MRNSEINKILRNKKVTHCYIHKGAYYRPESRGYTDYRHHAGVYLKEDAASHARRCRDLTIIPINANEHNLMIMAEVKDLISRLLT